LRSWHWEQDGWKDSRAGKAVTRAGTARHAARRDANEPAVVAALEKVGCIVETLSKKGVPDLMVWSPFQKRIVLLEVKDGTRAPSSRKLRPDQLRFHAEWLTAGAPVFKVEDQDQALEAVGFQKPTRKATASPRVRTKVSTR
jgi:hypothetical protein